MSNEEKAALRKRLRGLRPDGETRRQESALICCLLQEWVRGGFAEDLHTLTRLICRCFAGFQIPECTPDGQQPACGN